MGRSLTSVLWEKNWQVIVSYPTFEERFMFGERRKELKPVVRYLRQQGKIVRVEAVER